MCMTVSALETRQALMAALSVSWAGKLDTTQKKKVVTTILRRYEVPFRIDCKNFPWTLCMHLREP